MTRSSRVRWVLGIVLALSFVVSAAFLVGTLLLRSTGGAQAEQRAREDVMSRAQEFMLRINTYGPDLLDGTEMPSYRTSVAEVITPKFDADFEKNVPAAEATVAQGGLSRVAQVFGTGVSSIDEDSATALVAGSFTNSYPEKAGSTKRVDAEPSPFRVQVSLVKSDGRWLVDDFSPINTLDDDADPGALPSDPASIDPTIPLPSEDPTSEPSTEPSTEPSSGSTP